MAAQLATLSSDIKTITGGMSRVKKPDLEFPQNSAGEYDGLGDAGIETFRDASYASCAREAGQNSRDAASGNGEPVRMTFNVLQLPRDQFPAIDPKTLNALMQEFVGLLARGDDTPLLLQRKHAHLAEQSGFGQWY